MNREGKTYRSEREEVDPKFAGAGRTNGSVILVTRSVPWSPDRPETSNYTHHALVLECPLEPSTVGREVRIDERYYIAHEPGSPRVSSFKQDDGWLELGE